MFDTQKALEIYRNKRDDVALISDKAPLLRDLSIIENIALILEYHEKKSIKKANEVAFGFLQKCNIDHLSFKKVYEIDKKDNIIVRYIRAYISSFDTILIDKPFSMLDNPEDMDIVFGLTEILRGKTLEILDLSSNDYYKDKDVIQ